MPEADNRSPKSRAALQELERSLVRLEKAIKGRKNEQALMADLEAARASYDRLASTARGVDARLEGVRERLLAVLGS